MNQIRFFSENCPLKFAWLLRKLSLYSIEATLAVLLGCSSSNILTVDLDQPVYFGALPKAFPLDSSMVELVDSATATSFHVMEKEQVITSGSGNTITKGGANQTSGHFNAQIANVLHDNPDLFIGNSHMQALIEAFVPATSYFNYILALFFFTQSKSNDLGEVSIESIDFSGKIYKRKNKR